MHQGLAQVAYPFPRLARLALVATAIALCIFVPTFITAQIDLGSVQVDEASTTPVTVTFNSPDTIGTIEVLTQGSPSSDFTDAGGGTCRVGVSYPTKATCTVNVRFKPQYSGTRYGAIVLSDSKPTHHGIATLYVQADGSGPQAIFEPGLQQNLGDDYYYVVGVAADGAGNLIVADAGDILWGGTTRGVVYKETLVNGKLTRVTLGHGFIVPWGVAVDGRGNIYVTDAIGKCVYKEEPQPDGSYSQVTLTCGIDTPVGIAVDGSGNVYFADFGSGTDVNEGAVYKETLHNGNYTQSTIGEGWTHPYGVAVDSTGTVYVANFATLAGGGGVFRERLHGGQYFKTAIGSGWGNPVSIAVDGTGNLYVGDAAQLAVFRETLVDGEYVQSLVKQDDTGETGLWPHGVAVDGKRTVFIADSFYNSVYRLSYDTPPSLSFANTAINTKSEDGPKAATILNVGDLPLSFSEVNFPTDFPERRPTTGDCKTGSLLAAGDSCALTALFAPRSSLGNASSATLKEAITVKSDSLNEPDLRREINVNGVEVKSLPKAPTPVITPSSRAFAGPYHVKFTDPMRNATIYFTIDGSTPTTTSLEFYSWESSITLTSSATVKAIAVAPEHSQSAVASATFTIK